MGTSDQVSLGALRVQARQRSDMENNDAVTDPEFNGYISNSYKRLYNMLIGAYGNDYYVADTYNFTTTSAQAYALPDGTNAFTNASGGVAKKFYKLLGVDLQYSASPSGFVTLRRFEMIERNKYAYPNTTTNWNGYTNLRYRLQGNDLFLVPIPQTGQTVRVWYAPAPTNLQYILTGSMSATASTMSFTSVVGLTPGMKVYGDGVRTSTTIQSVNSSSNIVTLSSTPTLTNTAATVYFWDDSKLLEGLAGWDEFVIIDAAIKAGIKQENDISALIAQRNDMQTEIEALAEGRDAGQAMHVSDALSANSNGDDGFGGGWGGLGF